MLRRHQIPPQPGYPFTVNRKFPSLNDANIRVADGRSQLMPWSEGDGKRKLIINGFDAAAGNTSMLIEDPPPQTIKQRDPRTHHVVLCSGRTPTSISANKSRLQRYLTETEDVKLHDLAYTTTARRLHEVCRDAYVVNSVEELIQQLNKSNNESTGPKKLTGSPLVFAFTGQSSQYTAMGATLLWTPTKLSVPIRVCLPLLTSSVEHKISPLQPLRNSKSQSLPWKSAWRTTGSPLDCSHH